MKNHLLLVVASCCTMLLCHAFPGAANKSNELRTIHDLLDLDAMSLSRAIKAKEVSCLEVMQATLDRIEAVNPRCNAIILIRDKEDLLAEAREADNKPRKGWLHGIPAAVKDISNAKDLPTTMGGSRLSKNFIPKVDDFHVKNMREAGCIIIGKTNTPENGLGSHTFNEKWGTTRNPFNLSRSAGGSSGGAAVAVATRMLCLADGTDMMGSLRNPAGWNAIYSHRPTAGLIRGSMMSKKNPLLYPTSTAGPMARNPSDCAMLLETMAGKDRFSAADTLSGDLQVYGLRIGWLGDWGGRLPFEGGVLETCRNALDRLEARGITTNNINEEIFPLDQLWTGWNRIRFGSVSSLFAELFNMDIILGNNSPIKKELQWEIEQGLQVTEEELVEAKAICERFIESLDAVFEEYDVLALPSAQLFPFPQEWRWPEFIGKKKMDTYHRWMQVCVPVSLAGLPCSTIPAGLGDERGLPIGVTLFARQGEDAKTLTMAQAYHECTDWPSRIRSSANENSILTADS